MRRAVIEIEMDSDSDADIIFRSVEPEVEKKIPKTTVRMMRCGKKLILEIESKDTSSLRAACNSFLRWVETAKSITDMLRQG